MTVRSVLLFSSILSAGLMSGLLYGWMVSVIPGLSRISDRNYVSTMQSINRAIINPAFVLPFILVPAVLGAAAFVHWRNGQTRTAAWLAAGAATYLFGVLGTTFGGNVPLNNTLDAFDLAAASEASLSEQRHGYETPWNRWHNVRTAASVLSLTFASIAALGSGD